MKNHLSLTVSSSSNICLRCEQSRGSADVPVDPDVPPPATAILSVDQQPPARPRPPLGLCPAHSHDLTDLGQPRPPDLRDPGGTGGVGAWSVQHRWPSDHP